jgi:hypothetical protein
MTINVYWSRANPTASGFEKRGYPRSNMLSPLRVPAPVPMVNHLDYKEFFGELAIKCPAIVDDLKNTFVIKSPVDLQLNFAEGGVNVQNQTVEFTRSFLGDPMGRFGMHQLELSYLFFAESNLVMTQLPAYYDNNSFVNNTFQLTASFDIGRWFRVAGKPSFIIKPDTKCIDIKEGDALMYVKFNTKEKVKLIEFSDDELQSMGDNSFERICATLKDHSSGVITLEKCYQYFEQYNMRKRILKMLKRNKV